MKNKNNITKIMLLTCLIVGGSVNAENFFTCVPDESWFKKNFELNMLEEKFKVAKTQIDNNNAWELVAENQTSGSLSIGIYKVVVAGGGGGNGGGSTFNFQINSPIAGGNGGGGEIRGSVFFLTKRTKYYSCFGKKGSNASYGRDGGSGGGGGAGSVFKLENGSVEIKVSGGGGGGGGSGCCGGGGGGGGGYGCAEGGMGGYGDDYSALGRGGGVTYSVNLFGVSGKPGNEDSGSSGGAGGSGYVNCANGGFGASRLGEGYNGGSCGGNSGDGYVKIYKYIG